jgi:DNA gyrase subunit A
MERPDLSKTAPEVRAYIEFLEQKLRVREVEKVRPVAAVTSSLRDEIPTASLPPEPPTSSINIVTISTKGFSKRSLRHEYTRQHRAGMGVFDLDVDAPDFPDILVAAEPTQNLLLFTNTGRVFRQKLSILDEVPVRNKGQFLLDRLPIEQNEQVIAALPEQAQGYVAMVSEIGRVRCFRHHLFGEHMRPGATYLNKDMGPLSAVCWTPGDADLFILSKHGIAIRFSEKLVSPQGEVGLKLAAGDKVTAIASVRDDSRLYMMGADGKGAVRVMTSFAPNKSVGGSGKIAIKNDSIVGAFVVEPDDDIFAISRMSKLIRFPASEVPETEGVVQGVNCMNLRADEVVAVIKSSLSTYQNF